jgi:hypothetical protein
MMIISGSEMGAAVHLSLHAAMRYDLRERCKGQIRGRGFN